MKEIKRTGSSVDCCNSLKMVHEEQVVPGWKCKLHKCVGDVFSLSHFAVLKVERQYAEILANYSYGVDLGAVFLMR